MCNFCNPEYLNIDRMEIDSDKSEYSPSMFMKKFRFATVNIPWIDRSGDYHDGFVVMSDADTPMEHCDAVVKNELGIYTPNTVIRINGFQSINKMHEYCMERNLIPV